LAALGALVENAKREAGASRQLVTDLERVVQQLRDAEKQSLEYLEGVNEALAEAFEKFTVQLAGAVRESTKQTDTHLGNGVQQLTGVVQEISAMVGRLRKVA
jgi:ABC-type transporter Mla subunit MlaD